MAGEVWKDLVQEKVTAITGTGAYTLAGAVTGCRTFAEAYGNSSPLLRFRAMSVDASGNPDGNGEEIGQGTFNGTTTLARTSITQSSNGNAAVNWSAQNLYIAVVDDALQKDNWRAIADGKLTLTSGTPFTTADVTAVTNVFYTPFRDNLISIYDTVQSAWKLMTFVEKSLALGTLVSGKNYDVFGYDAGSITALAVRGTPTSGTLAASTAITVPTNSSGDVLVCFVYAGSMPSAANGWTRQFLQTGSGPQFSVFTKTSAGSDATTPVGSAFSGGFITYAVSGSGSIDVVGTVGTGTSTSLLVGR